MKTAKEISYTLIVVLARTIMLIAGIVAGLAIGRIIGGVIMGVIDLVFS